MFATKAEAKRELRKAIAHDVRSAFYNWPEYLHEFEDVLTVIEIEAEADRLFIKMEKK